MDSDDDMSGLSSQDGFNEDLDSDDGSLDDGRLGGNVPISKEKSPS